MYRSPPPTRNRIINATTQRFNLERKPFFCALSSAVEKTIPAVRLPYSMRIALACAISAIVCVQSNAQPSRPKTPVIVAPPQPLRISTIAKRGEPVEIPLGIYGTRSQTLEFKIRARPTAGKLSEPKQVAQESAVVVYTPPEDLAISKDQFSYSVRSREGVSAPSFVQISIVDANPVLAGPTLVEFGCLMTGEKTILSIEIANDGGGLAQGTLEVSPPWQLASSADYRLRAGEKQSVVLSIVPPQGGRIAGELRCVSTDSKTSRFIELRAEAVSPVSLRTEQLTLENQQDSTLRSGFVELTNNTDAPQILSISACPRLILPETLTLAPQTTSRIPVELPANDFAGLEDEIRIQSSAETLRVPVRAKATPAILQIDRQEIQFQTVQTPTPALENLTLENKGGSPAPVSLLIQPPFSAGFSSAVLQPGERKEIPLLFHSGTEGKFNGHLKIIAPSREITIPLSAQAIGSATLSRTARSDTAMADITRSAASNLSAGPDLREAAPAPQEPARMPPRPEIIALTPTTADLGWNHRGPEHPAYKSEMRQLSLKNDELEVSWSPLPQCQLERRGGRIEVKIAGLTPGTTYGLRFTPVDQTGQATDLPRALEFITPRFPEKAGWITLPRTLIVLLCLCLVGIARRQWTGNF